MRMAGKLGQAVAAGGQFGFLNDHDGKAILDLELESAALTDETIAFQGQPCLAGIHRTTKNLQQVGTDHRSSSIEGICVDKARRPHALREVYELLTLAITSRPPLPFADSY